MKRVLIALVKGYRLVLSPSLGNACRFTPTCSVYSLEALETHGARLAAGENFNMVFPIIQYIGYRARPVLVVLMPFRQRPELVTSVVNPLPFFGCLGRRNILSFVLRIHEKIRMAAKCDLHQAAS